MLIITAFRGDFTYKENVNRNKQLASKIKKAGFGYVFIDGHWIEADNPDTSGKEDSIMVNGTDSDLLKKLGIKWMKEYNQDSVVFKPTGTNNADLIFQNGKTEKLGVVTEKELAKIKTDLDRTSGSGFSKLRNRGERTFVFEGFRIDENWISKLSRNYKW